MKALTESVVEEATLDLFEELGYVTLQVGGVTLLRLAGEEDTDYGTL
jgi:hypothetical protein